MRLLNIGLCFCWILGVGISTSFAQGSADEFVGNWRLQLVSKKDQSVYQHAGIPSQLKIQKATLVKNNQNLYFEFVIPTLNITSNCKHVVRNVGGKLQTTIQLPTHNNQHWGSLILSLEKDEARIEAQVESSGIIQVEDKVIRTERQIILSSPYQKD